jgi:hypothetical protein
MSPLSLAFELGDELHMQLSSGNERNRIIRRKADRGADE